MIKEKYVCIRNSTETAYCYSKKSGDYILWMIKQVDNLKPWTTTTYSKPESVFQKIINLAIEKKAYVIEREDAILYDVGSVALSYIFGG
jgi:dsDNA-binding SOS-regulon protein